MASPRAALAGWRGAADPSGADGTGPGAATGQMVARNKHSTGRGNVPGDTWASETLATCNVQ